MTQDRIKHEIEHGKRLTEVGQGELWYWASPAGQIRLARRQGMLTSLIKPGMNVLEIGCGPGYFTKVLAETKANILAIDISPDLLEFAKKEIKSDNVTLKVENAYDLQTKDAAFDIIVGSAILHHLDLKLALKEFKRVLKPGGAICFTEPNMLNPHVFLERKIPFLREYFHVSPDETAFIRWKLKKVLKKFGYTDIEVIPFDFLHPLIPKPLITAVKSLGAILEHVPLIREIAGSVYIKAKIS